MTAGEAGASGPAHVQVVRGTPDDVELAALVAGLVAATGGGEDGASDWPGSAPRAGWADRARTVPGGGATWRPGPDAWRHSLR